MSGGDDRAPATLASGSGWILLIDDEPALLEAHRAILEEAGHICWTATSGDHALSLLKEHEAFAVVVSDLRMPGMDGLTFGAALRRDFAARPWLQLVFLTDLATLDSAISALRLGAVDFLAKPVDAAQLLAAITLAQAKAEQLHAATAPGAGQQLQALKAEVATLARDLMRFADNDAAEPTGTEAEHAAIDAVPTESEMTNMLRAVMRVRSARNPFFTNKRLGGQSWDMLLELALAKLEHRKLPVSSLCIASNLPQSTALRRIDDLQEAGLVSRFPDEQDARRDFVELSNTAMGPMHDWLRMLRRIARGLER